MAGKVYLIGAGPGAIELYTLKAMDCLKKADCLVYDRLVDPRILTYVPQTCECIYVGKASHQHTLQQEEINELLVTKAQQYQNVIRLKGGDVYVFGRGGEEALKLLENDIEFEVVPGLSSSIAGLCYAGIPITHRGLSSGFEVITAHHKNNTQKDWDYHRFLEDDLTYVFMMGLSELENIVIHLLEVGKNPQTPMALISNATLPIQQSLYGTLETIISLFQQSTLESPMLIVMGKVVSLHNQLDFFEKKVLHGKRVLITSLNHHDSLLHNYFESQGAIVERAILGHIKYLDFTLDMDLKNKLIVFTSQNGVKGFFRGLQKLRIDYRQFQQTRFACIGKKTANVLLEYGFISDATCEKANSIDFNLYLKDVIKNNESLLIVSNDQQSSIELITPQDMFIQVYCNEKCNVELANHDYDLVTFSCASSVYRLSELNCHMKKALSIGMMTTKAIEEQFKDVVILEADESSYCSMIKKMEENIHVF